MDRLRGRFEGVNNIIRFNWHFYIMSLAAIGLCCLLSVFLIAMYATMVVLFAISIFMWTILSLLVSHYIYDRSGLYSLSWISDVIHPKVLLNVHAGYDETSYLLQNKYSRSELIVMDFYDPLVNTEVSIRRARNYVQPYPGTKSINSHNIPLPDNKADMVVLIFAAHEIRKEPDRVAFFKEIARVLKPDGTLYLVEHLRDVANFLVYSLGAFHFLSRQTWEKTLRLSGLQIQKKEKLTPFVTVFTIQKHGISS